MTVTSALKTLDNTRDVKHHMSSIIKNVYFSGVSFTSKSNNDKLGWQKKQRPNLLITPLNMLDKNLNRRILNSSKWILRIKSISRMIAFGGN